MLKDYNDFRNLLNKIDNSIKGEIALFGGTVGSSFYNIIDSDPIAQSIASAFGISLGALSLYLYHLKRQMNNVKYLEEYKTIYQDILLDLTKLSSDLEVNSVIEQYAFLLFIYKYGFLSCSESDKSYYNLSDSRILPLGSMCLNNHGVCRHTSFLGHDYFERLGYESETLIGFVEDDLQEIDNFKLDSIKKYKNIFNGLNDYLNYDKNYFENKKCERMLDVNNHMIFKVNDINYSYFFDISNDVIYNTYDYKNFTGASFKFSLYKGDYSRFCQEQTKKIPNKEAYDSKLAFNLQNLALKKFYRNMDLFEKFNSNNEDKLEEAEAIYSKVLKNRNLKM